MSSAAVVDPSTTPHKIGALFTLMVVGSIGSLLPYLLSAKRFAKVESTVSAFAGGAFIGLAWFHLLPESLLLLDKSGIGISFSGSFYNLCYVFAVCGIFIAVFMEKILWLPRMSNGFPSHHYSVDSQDSAVAGFSGDIEKATTVEGEQNLHPDRQLPLVVASVVLMTSISVHSFFEGTVVGVSDEVPLVWLAVGIIVAHKWVEGFALSSSFIRAKLGKLNVWICLAVFVSSSPIGVLVGMLVSQNTATAQGVAGVFDAFSLGMILFIGYETLMDSLKKGSHCAKVLCFIAAVLAAFLIFGLFMVHMQYHPHNGHAE